MIYDQKDFKVGFGYRKIEEIIEAKKVEADKRINNAKEKANALMRKIEVLDMELGDAEDAGDKIWEKNILDEIEKKQEAIIYALEVM